MSVPFRSKSSAMEMIARLRPRLLGDAPMSAMIEIADRCNEVCVHCYQVQGQKGELETDDWRAILDELAQMGILFLTVSGGEATLRRDMLEIIAHARELKFAVKLFTNALRVDEEMADELARLAVQEVQISLYSPVAETHDWVTGVPGSFDKIVRATRLLRERGVAVVLKSVLTSFNFDDRHRYVELAESLEADYMLDLGLDSREDGDRGPQSFALTRTQLDALAEDPLFQRPESPPMPENPDRHLCGACSGMVHVEADGSMQPCALLPVDLGNARDGVASTWRGERAQQIRTLRWRDIHGCRDCDLQGYCTRCFASSLREGGDALGPYATACEKARMAYERHHGVSVRVNGERATGPYRVDAATHLLTPVADERTEHDAELAGRLGWTRGAGAAAPAVARPGQLVQIRRPGGKKCRSEAVPSSQTETSRR